MKINSRNELYKYLDNLDWNHKRDTPLSSVYFLVTFNKHTEPVYFTNFEDAYFESPCELHRFPIKSDEIEEYVRELYYEDSFNNALEYEKTMQRGEWHYDIDCPQCDLFLPEQLDNIEMISETECLDWLLKHCTWK